MDDVLHLWGVPVPTRIREGMVSALLEFDERASRLDAFDLPNEVSAHVVVSYLLPALGMRFGAAAALLDAADPVVERLCEPLSMRTFGHIVEHLLRERRSDLPTWDKRMDALSKAGINRRTIERWRAGQTALPSATKMLAFSRFLGTTHADRDLALLRGARALAALREELQERLGEEAVCEAQAHVASWSRATAAFLRDPLRVADLADWLAAGLAGPTGAGVLARIATGLGHEVAAGAAAADLARALMDAAAAARNTADAAPLRWLVQLQVADPHPGLQVTVGLGLGDAGSIFRAQNDGLDGIQLACRMARDAMARARP